MEKKFNEKWWGATFSPANSVGKAYKSKSGKLALFYLHLEGKRFILAVPLSSMRGFCEHRLEYLQLYKLEEKNENIE